MAVIKTSPAKKLGGIKKAKTEKIKPSPEGLGLLLKAAKVKKSTRRSKAHAGVTKHAQACKRKSKTSGKMVRGARRAHSMKKSPKK
jgi:hypothetical protein